MTLPCEQFLAMQNAREFLRALLDRRVTKKIPLKIRREAYDILRHYPWPHDIERMARAMSDNQDPMWDKPT
jgi:hypothetical protein